MSSRSSLLSQILLLALAIGSVIVGLVLVGLLVGGAFSMLTFARVILLIAVVVLALQLVFLPRTLRVAHEPGPSATWRVADRTPGCGRLLVLTLAALGLLACGGLMEWWLELR